MGNNVGGNFTIKLASGKTVSLNKLDELVNKSTVGSVFAWVDGQFGGVKNNLFDQAEVDALKQQIMQAHYNGNLSQDDLDKILETVDQHQSKKSSETNKLPDPPEPPTPETPTPDASKPEQKQTQPQNVTTYVVQPGDSPKTIAKKLGLSGAEAERVIEHLRTQLNSKGWFEVGQKVSVLGDHKAKIEELRRDTENYSEDKTVLLDRWAASVGQTKKTKAPAATQGKPSGATPEAVTKMINEIKGQGGKVNLIKNDDGTFSLEYSGSKFTKENNLSKVILKYNANGKIIEQTNFMSNGDTKKANVTYTNGKAVYNWENSKKYDTTPAKNRKTVAQVKTDANKGATEIKAELKAFWTSNDEAKSRLKKYMTNPNAAYVIEKYPDIVKDIDNVMGLDIQDIKTYVIKPLNARLNELGQNKLAIKDSDLKGKSIAQVQTMVTNLAKTIRSIDSANGYVYVPDANNKGKLQKPKRADQMGNYVEPAKPKPKTKTTAQTPVYNPLLQNQWQTQQPFATTPFTQQPAQGNKGKAASTGKAQSTAALGPVPMPTTDYSSLYSLSGTQTPNKVQLTPTEQSYPKEVQEFILEARAKGIEYIVNIKGSQIELNINYLLSKKPAQKPEFSLNPNISPVYGVEDKKVFKYNAPVNVAMKVNELNELTGNKGVTMQKNQKGVYTITQTEGLDKSKNLSHIEYVYNADGKFQYQLEYSSQDESVKIGRLKNGKITYTQFKDAKGNLTNANLPVKLQQQWSEIKGVDPNATFVRGKTYYTITQTKGVYLDQNGLTKVVYKYDGFGNLVAQDNTYANGRTINNYYNINDTQNDGAHNANPISIRLPDQYKGTDANGTSQMIYGLQTAGPKATAQRFANGITSNKAQLMKSLHLTNEEYDNLAIIAMGIAEQETHFGQEVYEDTSGNKHHQDRLVGMDGWSPTSDRARRKKMANAYLWSTSEQMAHSQGITQIRFKDAIDDADTKRMFMQNGILLKRNNGESEQAWLERSFKAFLASPEKQAVATMILLKQRKNIAEGTEWQQRLLKNNAKVSNPEDRLTTNDIIAMSWNGLGGLKTRLESGEVMTINSGKRTVKTGNKRTVYSPTAGVPAYQVDETKELNGCFYAFAVRKYANHFFADPRQADSGSIHLTTSANKAGANMATGQDNGGMLGEVVFKPNSYTNKGRVFSSQSTADMHALIDANTKLSDANKQLLKDFITNKQISFGTQGLKEAEAMSITNEDVQRMKSILAQIDAGTLTPNQANEKFETAQIEARQFTVSKNSVPASSILTLKTSSTPRDMRLLPDLSFDINKGFYTGIKRNTASPVSFGASSYQNTFAVTKSKGVNPYLSNGKLARDVDRVAAEHAHYTANTLFNSGGHCKNGISVDLEYSLGIDHTKIRGKGGRSIGSAKELVEFYNAHPEVFDHIKWVDMGNGQARELNSTDVANLPCGYYGVFSPGEGKSLDESVNYDEQHGHAFVSDGFGEANADEHDNGKWTHFTNGKGEHGKLDVYKLSNNVVAVYSETLGRTVNVPLNMNPWYLTPEWQKLQAQERQKRGLPPLEAKQEF